MSKRKIKVLSLSDKLKIVNAFESGKSRNEIQWEFNLPESTYYKIIKSKDSIKSECSDGHGNIKRTRVSEFPNMEKCLLEWIKQTIGKNISINGPLLKEKSKEFAAKLGIQNFSASNGWLEGFKRRHGIGFKKPARESKSVNQGVYNHWTEDVPYLLESQTCTSCKDLKKDVLNTKQILENVVSALKRLSETKDFNILETILQLIYKKIHFFNTLIPPEDNSMEMQELDLASPRKEVVANESMLEIEGTPTGKKSPIMIPKTETSRFSLKDKKKCSEWPIPEPKTAKIFPTSTKNTMKLKQSRTELVKLNTTCVADLNCSPELKRSYYETNIQNIKQEVIDNDDTILPMSVPVHFQPILNTAIKLEQNDEIYCPDGSISLMDCVPKMNTNTKQFMTKLNTEDKDIQNKLTKNINVKGYDFKTPIKLEQNDETYCPVESIWIMDRFTKMDTEIKLMNR